MRHVFVETNWVYGFAAPAHHKQLAAVDLLNRARTGALQLHLPAPCLFEARGAIRRKCQPRQEAKAIRDFLKRAKAEQSVSADHDRLAREVLQRFEQQMDAELTMVDATIASLRSEKG